MAYTFEQLRNGYTATLAKMAINPDRRGAFEAAANRIIKGRTTYEQISRATGVPWWFIGVLHLRESNLNFNTHLHNGDPLSKRTVRVPPNRPVEGTPPFTFVESAIDALKMKNLHKITDWSDERICYELERYNGFGYRGKVNSPYLWAGTNQYTKGKYIADHVWSASAVDQQLGTVPLVQILRGRAPAVTPRPNLPAEIGGTVAVGTGGAAATQSSDKTVQTIGIVVMVIVAVVAVVLIVRAKR